MRKLIAMVLPLFLIITGCSFFTTGKDELKWFHTLNEAVENGAMAEGITMNDIIGKVEQVGEVLVVYKKDVPDGLAVGVASISQRDGTYSWFRESNPVLIKNIDGQEFSIKTEISTQSSKRFAVYLGIASEQNKTINITIGTVTPIVDKESQIFYYIEPKQ